MTGSLVTHLQSLEEFLKKTEDKIQAPGFSVTAQTVQDVVDDVRVRQVAMMKQLVCACNVHTHLQSLEEFLKKTEDKIQAPGFSVTAQTVQDVVDDVRVRQVAMMKQLVCACNVQNFVLPIKPHTPTDAFLATLMQEQALLERES